MSLLLTFVAFSGVFLNLSFQVLVTNKIVSIFDAVDRVPLFELVYFSICGMIPCVKYIITAVMLVI